MLDAATGHESEGATRSKLLLVADQASDEQGLRSAIQALERRGDASCDELVASLIKLASYHVSRGGFKDAEPLLSRALSVSERHADLEQSDIAILLNDFARICLKQSAYTLAEPLLMRLLAIKQIKGENRPEVATVMASLAAVRQALGHHESAEQLWRRVLEIRERTLAPNHFSVASALEHLAESCAARGKIDEALQLYQRAQTIRQLTLGNNHSSLRITRDRIADLQLQASEDSLSGPDTQSAPVSPPDGVRLRFPAERRMISPVLLVPPTREGPGISEESQAVDKAVPEPVRSPVVDIPVREPQAADAYDRAATTGEIGMAPYQNILLSIAEEFGDDYEDGTRSHRYSIPSWISGFLLQNRRDLAIAGAVAVTILVGAWAWDSNAGRSASRVGGDDQPAASAAALAVPIRPPAAAIDPQTTPRAAVAPGTVRSRAPQVSEPTRRGSDRREANSIAIPNVSAPATLNIDSAVTAAGAATRRITESMAPDLSSLPALAQRSSFENVDLAAPRAHRAILIGDLPAPTLPYGASGVEGDVLVSFAVDIEGRPKMSTFSVVKSPDPMLSSAVRKVIPTMRFEPARSGGPDGKRVVDTVQVAYHFASKR